MAYSWQTAWTAYCSQPKFHHQLYNNLLPQFHPLSTTSASLTNQYIISPPALCSLLCLCVAQPRTGPNDQSHGNNTTATGWLGMLPDAYCFSLPITSLGARRDTQLIPKDQNKLGSCPKESEEGPLLARWRNMRVLKHKDTGMAHVDPSPYVASLAMGTPTAKAKW